MRPMFSYMGSKWRIAKKYGSPRTNLVIEPFAGAACYSLYWNAPNVILYDVNPIVAGIWEYLIRVSETEVLKLPVDFDSVDELQVPQEAKWLIGFWITKGNVHPNKSRSAWARKYRYSGDCKVWGPQVRDRIVIQLHQIRNWKVFCDDYRAIPNRIADWFIDPPYQVSGKHYPYSDINHQELAEFCLTRNGFTTVCGQQGENWLDFHPLTSARAMTGKNGARVSLEAVYQQQEFVPL